MKLKYIDIQGHGIFVDESAEIKEGDYYEANGIIEKCSCKEESNDLTDIPNKIIFTSKELNLDDVPILPTDWREWEVEQLAKKANGYLLYAKDTKDNTITIKPIKDSWTNEELTDVIEKYLLINHVELYSKTKRSEIKLYIEQNI